MSQHSIPQAAIRSAFETAARSFETQRSPQPAQKGAARQIAAAQGPLSVEQAIASAAQQTSVDFDFLVAQAQVESAMNPTARARTSSATGLYQFIESTWLETMHRHGDRFGLGNIAGQIGMTQGGTAYVSDPAARAAILDLRNDPQIAALMAAGLAEDNRAHLAPILGRQPDHGELYLAHFLGSGGAGRFLSAMVDNPHQSAADLFRRPAAANRPVFFERNGAPRTLAGVMDFLGNKIERARDHAGLMNPESYTAASLALAGDASRDATGFTSAATRANVQVTASPRPEYLIADEAVFGPLNPPTLTGRGRPTISASSTLALAAPASRGSMSNMLRSTFGGNGTQGAAAPGGQVARAYDQMKALGF